MKVPAATVLALIVLMWWSCACGSGAQSVVEERAQYEVELLSWVVREDGKIAATLRIDGPLRSQLRMLTVEIVRFGPGGRRIGSDWVTLDLEGRVGGVPVEKTVVLPPEPAPESLAVDLHAAPSEDVLPRLKEVQVAAR